MYVHDSYFLLRTKQELRMFVANVDPRFSSSNTIVRAWCFSPTPFVERAGHSRFRLADVLHYIP